MNIPEKQITQDETTGNLRMVGMVSPRRVITAEDLYEVFKINLDEWEVLYQKPNKWDGFFKDGNKEPVIVELYQIKATLVRKNIVPIDYTVKPVSINVNYPLATPETENNYKHNKTMFLPDIQIGFRRDFRTGKLDEFHDRKALSVALQVAEIEQPSEIVVMGDLLDFSEFSDKFIKESGFYFTTQPALEEAAWWLGQLRNVCPLAKIYLVEGNHDVRLQNYMTTHVISAAGLTQVSASISSPPVMSVPYLLGLDKIGVEYVNRYPNEGIVIGETQYIHGNTAKSVPGATAGKIADYAQQDTVFAHIHRIEKSSSTKSDGRTIEAVCGGCLCRVDFVVPGHARGQQWQQGFGIVNYADGLNEISTCRIINGEAMVNGHIYRHQAMLEQLRYDTKWDF